MRIISNNAIKKYLVEFIGTFFLVLTIGACIVNSNGGVIAPLAIGSVLMAMIFAGGHISGAHYNPAVTLAVALQGGMYVGEVVGYVISQVLGAILASGIVYFLKGAYHPVLSNVGAPVYDLTQISLAEFLYTFALVYVVLNVAIAKATKGNSFYGLAIGFIVTTGAFAVGAISGAAFNPAVVIGCLMMGLIPGSQIFVYIIVQLAAGCIAAFVFRFLNSD